jgi:uncharacterized protein
MSGSGQTPTVVSESAREPLTITLAGEAVVLHPERALGLPRLQTLVIADVHWGKATSLRALGVPVPPGGTSADLARLDALLRLTGATQLVVLGDLAHSHHGWQPRALEPVLAWRSRWPALDITLIRGNHDDHAGDPPASLGIRAVDAPHPLGPFACAHEPPGPARAEGPSNATHTALHGALTLCGHLHPNVRLAGRGRDSVRLPCFVLREHALVLPAFSRFTGGGAWDPAPGDRAFAITEYSVTPLHPS